MNGGQLPTNQLHDINWGELEHELHGINSGARDAHVTTINNCVCVCACRCVCVCVRVHVYV